MANWQGCLGDIAVFSEESLSLSFGELPTQYQQLPNKPTVTPLYHQGLIAVDGVDASRFLQGQLTCDVFKLEVGGSQPGACCNPKGRMLADFYLYRVAEHYYVLQMHRSLVAQTLEHLKKYAVFFKAALSEATEQYSLLGLSNCVKNFMDSDLHYAAVRNLDDGRQILLLDADATETSWQTLSNQAKPVGTEYWQLLDIQAGLGHIQLNTTDMFIPQMLNLQSVDAISFKKGCYTGQEVVARMKYLGKLKRHMYRITIPHRDGLPRPGVPCYLADSEQSIGNVVTAVCNGENDELLVVLKDEAISSAHLVIDGVRSEITKNDLPYSI